VYWLSSAILRSTISPRLAVRSNGATIEWLSEQKKLKDDWPLGPSLTLAGEVINDLRRSNSDLTGSDWPELVEVATSLEESGRDVAVSVEVGTPIEVEAGPVGPVDGSIDATGTG
jgi:hypothetical protein